MAQGVRFVCGGCVKAIESWSDGNPYYLDSDGVKKYAYHPDHGLLDRCIGNDLPHLCLACGAEFLVDSRAPVAACPGCGSADLVDTYSIGGLKCPCCKSGVFAADPDFHAIS